MKPFKKNVNDTSAKKFENVVSCCSNKSNSIYLHIFVYYIDNARKICPCQPTKPPMLLSSSCLRLFHVPKRYQKAITIMVLTLYCVNVAHPLTCTEHGQLTTKALQLRQLAFWVFVFVCIFPVANRLVVHIMSGDAQFVFYIIFILFFRILEPYSFCID